MASRQTQHLDERIVSAHFYCAFLICAVQSRFSRPAKHGKSTEIMPMRVADLIEELKSLPQDAVVLVGSCYTAEKIEATTVRSYTRQIYDEEAVDQAVVEIE